MEEYSKEIIVYKLFAQLNKPTLGYLRAVSEKVGDSYIPLNAQNFCTSEKMSYAEETVEINLVN